MAKYTIKDHDRESIKFKLVSEGYPRTIVVSSPVGNLFGISDASGELVRYLRFFVNMETYDELPFAMMMTTGQLIFED